ncbi:SapC family protein [Colwellia sp. MSW7]|uniref:SapC family protein n=1 Tax=Colwellia maritima TaxID=2912588 RepID=A0ABS9WZW0_9GAMM|nr:SapC family protein [Colwellia maritima]MCI2283535.1 SapC family protein [Colwellia maritima]
MANHVLLNNIEHKELKINSERSAAMGDNVWFAQTFPMEFRSAQAHYPILFQKDNNTGQFMPVTLFAFENNDNLFLKEGKWDATYIPLAVQRMPFYIGQQNVVNDGVTEQQRVITLDLDSPKVNTEQGINLFLEYGGNSDYLEHMANVLESLHVGLQQNNDFVELLLTCELLESVTLDIELNDGSKNQLIGFYTINEDKLNSLPQDTLAKFHNSGFLEAIYMVLASQANIHDLVARKNLQLAS